MADIIKRSKALSINPLKTSQPMGASLAILGLDRAMPMLHGSQGCTAFAKVFFVRHFREPIPLQTTAMDQVSSIMGADDNIVEGLKTVCEKARPAAIGLLTTSLAEVQGSDCRRVIKAFRARYPEFQGIKILSVNAPDFEGCLESGFAAAVLAMIDQWVPAGSWRCGRHPRQVNLLAGSSLTPGDLECLKDIVTSFGLQPVLVPDISGSLDGHLAASDFSPVTSGGTPVSAFATLGDSATTLVIGASMHEAADLLQERTGVPDHRFDHLMGLDAMDALLMALSGISGNPVPSRLERQRSQLQDTMLDAHFMLGKARIAVAADPDLLNAFCCLLSGMGADIVAAVASARAAVLESIPVAQVKLGDLDDLEQLAGHGEAELMIGSSHAAESARRLNVPLLRAGFPLYDWVGGYQRTWIGYQGSRQTLFDLANLLAHGEHECEPYRSFYSGKSDFGQEASARGNAKAFADTGWQH